MIGKKLKTAPPTGGHVFQQIGTTFFLIHFIGTKLLTKFHEDGTRNQMLTDGRTYDGQRPVTKAHLSNQINVLTKFHKDWMKTVTSTVYTNKLLTDTRTHTCRHSHTDAGHHTVT
ncbi:hypothetical protein DPMN_160552 [Dreissena polymorpha]|uniref:Uncharacterized protein n=1 Tax=Dreissena polymorpha TaxID=45954 RepID=A0A9D4EN19_DREPO|nr:hypothetical protein DPMN_160552 [Dreissena polymorpha]